MTTYYVSSGQTSSIDVGSSDVVYISSGGVLNEWYGSNQRRLITGKVVLSSGGILSGGSIYGGGIVSAASGSLLYAAPTVGSGGTLSGGTLAETNGTIVVAPSGTLIGTEIAAGAGGILQNGGITSSVTLNSGTSITVLSGSAVAITVRSGAQIQDTGGTVSGSVFQSGATLTVNSGAGASGNSIQYGGTVIVKANGSFQGGNNIYGSVFASGSNAFVNGYILSTGVATAISGALITFPTISAGGLAVASSGGSIGAAYAFSGGSILVGGGGVISSSTIGSGGVLSNFGNATSMVLSGGTAILESGGVFAGVSSGIIDGSGTFQVGSGAVLSGGTATSALTVQVLSGGIARGASTSSGGTFLVSAGGTGINNTNSGGAGVVSILSGGTGLVTSGATVGGQVIQTGGTEIIQAGGTAYGGNNVYGNVLVSGTSAVWNGYASSGGVVTAQSGGSIFWATINSGGTVVANAGGVLQIGGVNSGATALVNSGGTTSNYTVASAAVLSMASGGTIAGSLYVSGTGAVTIPATAGGTVALDDGQLASVTISGTTSPTTVISGFNGSSASASDVIKLADVQKTDVTAVSYSDVNHVTLTLKSGSSITLNILNVRNYGYTLATDSNGKLIYEVCFLRGVEIATPGGVRLIEDFAPGDTITTINGDVEQNDIVTWVGKATCLVNPNLADDMAGYPIVIARGALADNVPEQDFRVTAEHCLYLDGNFIPARMLVNGRSIYYDKSVQSYEYYHIETERHAVIRANGALTESYLDTGNRGQFEQVGNVYKLPTPAKTWEADGAASLAVEREIVEPVYRQIEARAETYAEQSSALSLEMTENPGLRLVTDRGDLLLPRKSNDGQFVFSLPPMVKSVRIMSHASRPYDTVGPFVDDRRKLGVLIGNVTLFDAQRTIMLTDHQRIDALSGWYEVGVARWTDGDATLTLCERDIHAFAVLMIQVLSSGPYLVADQYQDWGVSSELYVAE